MIDDIILNELQISDLNQKYQPIAEIIGIENLIALVKKSGGFQFYIPKMSVFIKEHRYKKLLNEYDGTNLRTLVTKYDISESTAYRIIKNKNN